MDINSAIFQTETHHILVKKIYLGDWYLQVMTGIANTTHVETKEFSTYKQAVDYAFETYNLVTD